MAVRAQRNRPANRGFAQRPVSVSVSLPAPTGGWNARDSLGEMPPLDAVSMVNMFPATTSVDIRNGFTKWATGISGEVETLLYYYGGSSKKKFAIGVIGGVGSIYNITVSGAVGAPDITNLSNARWQYTNNTTAGGSYIQLVNGLDKMRVYDGTAWHKDGDGVPYNITGVDSANLINITLHQNRIWFVQKNTLKAWYLATGAIGGAAVQFDLSSFAPHGGNLVGCYTWTIDAGYGVDDLMVFITSNGDVLVYKGTDPASAATWALVGAWWIGSPIGIRCGCKVGGDLAIICQDGLVPLARYLQSSRLDPRVAITEKIQYAMSLAISAYDGNFGWQLQPFPKENMLLLNVPVTEGASQQQYVMNTINKSWCNFTGWEANCWELMDDDAYFGSNGFVGVAWDGQSDDGVNINGNTLQAFNNFNSQGVQKRFTMMRPTLFTDGQPAILAQMNIDFDLSDPTAPLAFTPTAYGQWDTGIWDSAIWGGALGVQNNWQGATGIGYWAAPRLKTATMGITTQWISTTIVYESGAIL